MKKGGYKLIKTKTSFFLFLVLLSCCLSLATAACEKRPEFAFNFETDDELDRLYWGCGTLYSLSEQHVTSGAKSLKVDMYPPLSDSKNLYPGPAFVQFKEDWSGKNFLLFDVTNPQKESLETTLVINDQENPPYRDRYNGIIVIAPGANKIRIPFKDMITTGTLRPLDMSNICYVKILLIKPQKMHTLYFDNFRLE